MNKTVIGIIVVMAIVGVGFFIMKGYQAPAPSPSQSTTVQNPSVQTETASPNTVTIQDFAFKPSNLTVSTGTTVTWINEDTAGHTIKSGQFNSPDMKKGDTFQFTFTTPGTFTYNCGIHPTMVGTIIVK